MSANPLELALGGASQLGRAFRIVGVMPALVLVLYIFALLASRTIEGGLALERLPSALNDVGFAGLSFLLLAALAVAFLLQPLQFATVQLLEGYWGVSSLGHNARVVRIRRNVERRQALDQRHLDTARTIEFDRAGTPIVIRRDIIDDDALDKAVVLDEIDRLLQRYPFPHRTMPTRLGNVLRAHEDRAGSPWGLDVMTALPRMALVAPPAHLAYLQDRRNEMDTAVRFVIIWAIATAATLAALWPGGWWTLTAGVPWTLTVLSYLGAVGSADHYGEALSLIIDLNRPPFYDALGLPLPTTLNEEKERNVRLTAVLRGQGEGVQLGYAASPHEEGARP